jgi:hypothetical protein
LTGILNALGALEEDSSPQSVSQAEWLQMARQNAQRLHQALIALLDLAALESGTFHVRLREVDLVRIAKNRIQSYQSLFPDRQVLLEEEPESELEQRVPVLADPQKLGRAVELCLDVLLPRSAPNSKIHVKTHSTGLQFRFDLADAMKSHWESLWKQSVIGFQGGVVSPYSAFGGVLQSEQAFLSRSEEGLGSELLLIHEILRLHRGKLEAEIQDHQVILNFQLPELSTEESLHAVLSSRAYLMSTELGSTALVLIRTPEHISLEDFQKEVKKTLFRSSDAVYSLPLWNRVALVLDDCKPEDVPRLIGRIHQSLGRDLVFGAAHCPSDGHDPRVLLELAESRLKAKDRKSL